MNQYIFKIKYTGKFNYSWGYAMYSAFLESLDNSDSNEIHEKIFFNQYITPKEWIVNTDKIYNFKDEYYLKKYDVIVSLQKKKHEFYEEQDFIKAFLIEKPPQRKVRINFITPTTFKQQGEYALYPTANLIMNSLTNKWNSWAVNFKLEDNNWGDCKIVKYNLRSINYFMKGIRIRGFIGYVDIYFGGLESITRLGNMICYYGNYSGVGIKSTLGMGGILVE